LQQAHRGAVVVFDRAVPADVPGWHDLARRRSSYRALVDSLRLRDTTVPALRELRFGKGTVLVGPYEKALEYAGVKRETLVDRAGLEYLRRADGDVREYFLANRGMAEIEGWVPLAHAGAGGAVLMDAMTGSTGSAAMRGHEVYLQLAPNESIFVRTTPAGAAGRRWIYRRAQMDQAIALAGDWRVEFVEGGPEKPAPVRVRTLESWTRFAGEAGERFGGTARYTSTFSAPKGEWFVDLGVVGESARVKLNGRDLGTLVAAPWRVYAGALKPRGNVLEVEVTNLAANRIRDLDRRGVAWRVFNDINLVNVDYKPFDASGWPVRDSGLLGPVRLAPAMVFDPAKGD
jgi:hypothetical protein